MFKKDWFWKVFIYRIDLVIIYRIRIIFVFIFDMNCVIYIINGKFFKFLM